MENGNASSCPMGLQLAISKKPNGAPSSSTGGQAFKLNISPVDVPFAPPLFAIFKKPSFMSNGGDGSSGRMTKKHLERSQGNLMMNTAQDDRNKKILMQHQPSDKPAPISGFSSDVPSNCDQPRIQTRSKWDRNLNNSSMDPKKLKRILSNRLSAQKSRQKKFQYIDEMERKVKALEAEIALLTPQVAVQENQVALLKMENNFLNQKLASVEEKNGIKDAVVEQKREEVKRLKDVYRLQQQQMQARGMLGWKIGFI